MDDTDLAQQCTEWVAYANARPSQATDVAPVGRLREEAVKGGPLPATARQGDYGFLHAARVSPEALVAVVGNQYSVPIVHVGAPVTVRVHRERIVIWRDTTRLAEHRRAADGAHQRVVEPEHYSLLFAKKPRAQVMLYREALMRLGPSATWYVSEVSHRRRDRLRDEVVGIYTLYQQLGAERLLAAMDYATKRSAYGVDYLRALVALAEQSTPATWPTPLGPPPPILLAAVPAASADEERVAVTDVTNVAMLLSLPVQDEVDRALDVYERYVQVDRGDSHDSDDTATPDPGVLGEPVLGEPVEVRP